MPYCRNAALQDGFLEFPTKVQLQTTSRCNYNCTMCPYPIAASGTSTVMTFEIYCKILSELAQAVHPIKLSFSLQNEPTLDRRFLEFILMADRMVPNLDWIAIVSNGSALTREHLSFLSGLSKVRLTVSVNATDRERYANVHGRDFWPKILELLEGWSGNRSRVRVSFVVDPASHEEARNFREFWRTRGYRTRAVPINSRIGQVDLGGDGYGSDDSFGHCHYPVDTINILASGDVILCCNDWRHEQSFGSVATSSIREIWNSNAMLSVRRRAIDGSIRSTGPCSSCDYPMRSRQRVELEKRIFARSEGYESGDTGSYLQLKTAPAESSVYTALITAIDCGGVIQCVTPVVDADRLLVELRMGFGNELDFGSLEPIWCPGQVVSRCELDSEIEAVTIELERSAPEYVFFPWFCEDWGFKNSASPPGSV